MLRTPAITIWKYFTCRSRGVCIVRILIAWNDLVMKYQDYNTCQWIEDVSLILDRAIYFKYKSYCFVFCKYQIRMCAGTPFSLNAVFVVSWVSPRTVFITFVSITTVASFHVLSNSSSSLLECFTTHIFEFLWVSLNNPQINESLNLNSVKPLTKFRGEGSFLRSTEKALQFAFTSKKHQPASKNYFNTRMWCVVSILVKILGIKFNNLCANIWSRTDFMTFLLRTHGIYFWPSILGVINSKMMRWVGHVPLTG
jgi:hypothetical protein